MKVRSAMRLIVRGVDWAFGHVFLLSGLILLVRAVFEDQPIVKAIALFGGVALLVVDAILSEIRKAAASIRRSIDEHPGTVVDLSNSYIRPRMSGPTVELRREPRTDR